MKQTIENILAFSKLPLADQLKLISQAKANAKAKETHIEQYAKDHGIYITCHTDSNIAKEFKALTGFYCSVSRLYPTSYNKVELSHIWYQIRNTIFSYYKLLNAKILKDTVKVSGNLSEYEKSCSLTLLKKYKNGIFEYALNDDLLRLIHNIKTIDANYTRPTIGHEK